MVSIQEKETQLWQSPSSNEREIVKAECVPCSEEGGGFLGKGAAKKVWVRWVAAHPVICMPIPSAFCAVTSILSVSFT